MTVFKILESTTILSLYEVAKYNLLVGKHLKTINAKVFLLSHPGMLGLRGYTITQINQLMD